MKHDSEAVEVTNVQRAKVGVESIVKQVLVNREIDRRQRVCGDGCGGLLRS